ncbi:capsid protein [Velvet tobacco mottle virus]|uniref:Capsid protein n=1 Tax=Velvet tobacco mottle virus TaxID=12473 RepID=E2IZN3_9VIRU|nr:capsid protein [Velvet tobacco mottle virus]ADN19016.1 coat Protein [Velvet tobacco mottle virus]AEE36646.1 coat protein [Velvet tobacco mottle virus]AFN89802.1 coat protein [Velvet tobacco mottle virus]AFN89804.1 coat protein [Velvet tobacco mottle virus]AFN89808.1 coat protein [Velvet tobacco mottle virus]
MSKKLTKNQVKQMIQATLPKEQTSARSRRRRRRRSTQQGQSSTVMAPMAGAVIYRKRPMLINGRSGVTVRHSEVVLVVQSGTTNFSATSVTLAPNTFTWLAVQGSLYSKWRWISLRATYVPETASTTPGTVAMGFQYDNTDVLPTGTAGMSSLHGFVSGAPWSGFSGSKLLAESPTTPIPAGAIATRLDCQNFGLKWYQYKSVIPAGDSGNIYIPAQLIVGTLGTGSTLRYGEVHIQYEIEFIEPLPPSVNTLRDIYSRMILSSASDERKGEKSSQTLTDR